MTDKEIIKALNMATNIDGLHICCIDYENNPEKPTFLSIKSDIVDLINRQQAEIERLKGYNKDLQDEIEELKEVYHATKVGWATAKAEAIKEFEERLKEIYRNIPTLWGTVAVKHIDNLVKEMVGEDK